jgi:surface protein
MAVFDNARAFNGDLSKWQTSRVTNMDYTFFDAKSFNHKTTLDIAWEANNPSVYPGTEMFLDTCSLDPDCGKCGKKGHSTKKCASFAPPKRVIAPKRQVAPKPIAKVIYDKRNSFACLYTDTVCDEPVCEEPVYDTGDKFSWWREMENDFTFMTQYAN